MFNAIRARMYVAKVQAEIMAQHKDQQFVNTICQSPKTLGHLLFLKDQAFFRKDAVAPFIVACEVFAESLNNQDLPEHYRQQCAKLLMERLHKVQGNRPFRLKYLMIFGPMEEKVMDWMRENKVGES